MHTNELVSSALAAELTLISTILIAAILLRHINIFLTIIVVLVLGVFLVGNMPLIPRLKREQSESLEKMTFYAILTLGILAPFELNRPFKRPFITLSQPARFIIISFL